MAWPRDDAKLDRVRAADGRAGARRDRRARARQRPLPDELLGHEGLRRRRLPARGRADALLPRGVGGRRRAALRGRPTSAWSRATARTTRARRSLRTLERAAEAAREHGTVGLELSLGTQASDRMVGEPTTFTKGWFDAFGDAVDATPMLDAARAIKTTQEIERVRLANDIAAAAMDHVRGVIRPGMTEAQIASEWLGFVHGDGTGWAGQVELALGFSLVWAGPGIRTFTATSNRPVLEGEPTLFEIWVCADGYWCDHTKNVVIGELTERVPRARGGPDGGLRRRRRPLQARREPRGARRARPRRRRADRLSRPAVPPDLPRRRRPCARAAVRAPGRRRRGARRAWSLQSSQDATGREAAGFASRTTG